jgi:hypothetical protein
MLFGQKKTIEGVLVNNGPQPVAFNVLFPDEPERESQGHGQPESEETIQPGSNFVNIEPSEGMLKPYSQISMKIKIAPRAPEPKKGFTKQFLDMLHAVVPLQSRPVIDIPEIGSKLNLNITGQGAYPNLSLQFSDRSPCSVIRFGECIVGQRKDVLVMLENKLEADIDFKLKVPPHFKINHMSGTVYGMQRQTFIVSFVPTQMGKHKSVAKISFANGIATKELRLVGEAKVPVPPPKPPKGSAEEEQLWRAKEKEIAARKTGIEKLPDDYKPDYVFVETDELKPGAMTKEATKNKIAPMDSVEFLSSTSWDVMYDSASTVEQKVGQFTEVLDAQKKNRAVYQDYLSKSRTQRELKATQKQKMKTLAIGGADRTDPWGIDMGMERGLDEPMMALPPAGEPLWQLKGPGQDGGGQRMAFDENRLISKKYPKEPKQHQMQEIVKLN